MDFVDLDKVLDEFEEEEKAADSLTPGQEVRPSGYSEYLDSCRDKPWESVSEVPTSGIGNQHGFNLPGKNAHGGEMYNYDIPYDSGGFDRRTEYIDSGNMSNMQKPGIEFGKGDLNLSLDNVYPSTTLDSIQQQKNMYENEYSSKNADMYIESQPVVMSTVGEALKEHLNNSDQDYVNHSGTHNGVYVEDFIGKGIKASQVTAVQTDALTPRIEKELSSAPFPKSDIIVDGHEVSHTDIIVGGTFVSNSNSFSSRDMNSQGEANQISDNLNSVYSKSVNYDQTNVNSQEHQSLASNNSIPSATSYDSKRDLDGGSEVNGFDMKGQSHDQGAVVGFGDVTEDIDDDEVDEYLKDLDNQPQSYKQTDIAGEASDSKPSLMNPDIVLDVGRSENLRLEQSKDVQYAQLPTASNSASVTTVPDSKPVSNEHHIDTTAKTDVKSDTSNSPMHIDNSTEKVESLQCLPDKDVSSSESSLTDATRESSSAAPSEFSSSPSDQGSPQMMGIGARPKEPVKKNRPNSLLGLSKASMEPCSLVHEVVEQNDSVALDGSVHNENTESENQSRDSQTQNLSNSIQPAQAPVLEMPMTAVKANVTNAPPIQNTINVPNTNSPQRSGGMSISQIPSVNTQIPTNNPHMSNVSAGNTQRSTAPQSLSNHGNMQSGAAMAQNLEQKLMSNMEIRQQIEHEQRQRMETASSQPGGQQQGQMDLISGQAGGQMNLVSGQAGGQMDLVSGQAGGQMDLVSGQAGGQMDLVAEAGVPTQSDTEAGLREEGEMGEDMPVMRRGEDMAGAARPHSWSPSSGQAAPPGKMKRPTSLNLPPRGEFAVAGDRSPDMGGRMRRMKPDDIPEEESVGEEYSEGDGRIEASGMNEDDFSVPLSGDVPPSIIHTHLGRVAPTWVPDNEAPNCMQCQARFTFTKRRHHCRACGKVFCSTCCNQKTPLAYMDAKEARVCQQCFQILQSADGSSSGRSPNPNIPSEYCSTIPPTQQANARAPLPTVLVPSGVLKREGSQRRTEPKQVMFSDGIRPGGDLTELDGSNETRLPPRRMGRIQKKVEKGGQTSTKTRKLRATENTRNKCLIPEDSLPPLYTKTDLGDVILDLYYEPETHFSQIKDEVAEPVIFAINSNLQILVKILNLDCCVNRECWSFTTRGMCTVGQEEIVIVVECFENEKTPPRDIFCHFATVYEEAGKGNTVSDMGHTIFNQSFLDSRDHGGFLYLRATFQCLQKLILPTPPYLFGILLQKWETPWAKVFPLRLLLRLGAEYRYYPCPLVSIRNRKPVFFEIGHTIMNLLADFRNYQYMLPQIRGVHIHMEDKKTIISFPRNRYDELMKMVNSSNEHVMALGSTFSPDADSHLVCIQNDEGTYQTQAINIQNKPRKVTGASFVVFNGALKTSSGLRAKSSIVEDGLMVQILPESMVAVKQAIKDMIDYTIGCGSVTVDKPEEIVTLQWVDEDRNVNIGVKSPIDSQSMDGVESIHIHNSTDYMGENRAIRWTEVFFIQNEDSGARWEPVDLSRLAETLASATCISLSQHLDRLKEGGTTKIGLRVTIDSEQVGYEIGANNEKLADFYMNDLDSGLIPVIHGAASQSQDGPIVLELIFHILE